MGIEKISRLKAIAFLDYSNLHYGMQGLDWQIDFNKLKEFFKHDHDVIDFYYYVGQHSFKSYFNTHKELNGVNPIHIRQFALDRQAKKKVFKSLRQKGYIVRVKEIASIYDNTDGKYHLKCNADVELTVDALDRLNDYDVFILVSGDADFVRLIRYLKAKGKKAIVMAVREHFSSRLKKVANQMYNINGLRKELEYIKYSKD